MSSVPTYVYMLILESPGELLGGGGGGGGGGGATLLRNVCTLASENRNSLCAWGSAVVRSSGLCFCSPAVPRPRTLIPSVLSGNVARVDTILGHIKKVIDAIPKDDDGAGQVSGPGHSELEADCDSKQQEEASCPDSIPAQGQAPGTLMSQSSLESSVSQDEEMTEVADVQASGSSISSSSDRASPTLVASLQDVPCGAIVVRDSSDLSEPQTKRIRFSNPVELVGPDVPPREAESLMPDSFLVNPLSAPVSVLEHHEESSGSKPPALIEIDIDSEMQVVEKQDATSAFKTTTERDQQSCVNSTRCSAHPNYS